MEAAGGGETEKKEAKEKEVKGPLTPATRTYTHARMHADGT